MVCEPDARQDAREALRQELFRPSSGEVRAYAVLDMASDPRLWPALEASDAPRRCLFRGALHPKLREVAPHLAELAPDGAFTRWLLNEGFHRGFGIFVRSSLSLDELQGHFRRFLQVVDERGKKFYFRFYDPRVLGVYLPTCNAHELLAWFTGLESFLAERMDGATFVEHRLEESGRIASRILPCPSQGP